MTISLESLSQVYAEHEFARDNAQADMHRITKLAQMSGVDHYALFFAARQKLEAMKVAAKAAQPHSDCPEPGHGAISGHILGQG